jgi:hypothetical protein
MMRGVPEERSERVRVLELGFYWCGKSMGREAIGWE